MMTITFSLMLKKRLSCTCSPRSNSHLLALVVAAVGKLTLHAQARIYWNLSPLVLSPQLAESSLQPQPQLQHSLPAWPS